jgi:hypothetical protein
MAVMVALVWHHQFLAHKCFMLVAAVGLALPIQQVFRVDLALLVVVMALKIHNTFMVLAHQVLPIQVVAQVGLITKLPVEVLAVLA